MSFIFTRLSPAVFHLAILFFQFTFSSLAQVTFPVNGARDENHNYFAFTNATVFIDYKTKIDSATLLVRDGKIEDAGKTVLIPKNTVIYDLQGKYIYPSFIDIFSDYGMPGAKPNSTSDVRDETKGQAEKNNRGATGWNEAVKPETKSSALFSVNSKEARDLRNIGFGAVLSQHKDGIVRGTSTFVSLAEGKENEVMLVDEAAAGFSFRKGKSSQNYPSSLMGSIALIRQTYYDAEWYKNSKPAPLGTGLNGETNISLDYFTRNRNLPQIFETNDHLSVLRAYRIGAEFGEKYVIKGSGDEYLVVQELKVSGTQLIIPLDFPKPFDAEDPLEALLIPLSSLKHWELAPSNPAILEREGIVFAFTCSDLENKKSFFENIRKAKKFGLSDSSALKALTVIPARIIKADDKIGMLKKGMIANFLITSDSIFNEKNKIFENWVQGKQYVINDYNLIDIRGNYDLNINSAVFELTVEGEQDGPKGKLKTTNDTSKTPVGISVSENLITLSFENKDKKTPGYTRLSGKINYRSGSWDGQGQTPEGKWILWNAIRKEKLAEKRDSAKNESFETGKRFYPNMAYGHAGLPVGKPTLIKNATVWTNEKEGILKNTDVFLFQGKILAIGQNINPVQFLPKTATPIAYEIIDGTNKHLTAGIIDEHSHIAISGGVNEGSQAVTAEVRIGDVINPEDINIYRQLAGGVTASQLLHGSANPVGGQSAVIKLKWGFPAEEMKVKDATGFIKFALGENVKQSNWGGNTGERFPQTRMGIEQVFYEAFTRAREYDDEWKKFSALPVKKGTVKTPAPRRDLELDALAEVLSGKRFITCHSYVQSEVNMLMHLADSLGFRVNTFTHILEGYKIADKIKKHGAGASSFSDWWAYKFEVNDATPYNGAVMHEQGLTVAYNSDDAEMARRLNQEAAKAVKYGGVSEEEALKFVTLNPAKLLHLDDRMGSIKTGKDADLVLWSHHPLSVYAKAEKTFVDGLLLFDINRDIIIREEIQKERSRIISKMISAKKSGESTKKPSLKPERLYRCDSIGE